MQNNNIYLHQALPVAVLLSAILIGVFGGNQWLFLHINALQEIIPGILAAYITMFGDTAIVICLFLPVLVRNERLLYALLLTLISGGLLVHGMKALIALPRPPAVIDPALIHVYGPVLLSESFPSGHSFAAWSSLALLVSFYPRRGFVYGLAVLALSVSLSRVVLGVHWPLDVLFGGVCGWWLGQLNAWVVKKTITKSHPYVHGVLLLAMLLITLHLFWYDNGYPATVDLQYVVTVLSLLFVVFNARYVLKARS